jgi:hypothetical protein
MKGAEKRMNSSLKDVRVYDNIISDDLLHFIQKEINNMHWEKHLSNPHDKEDQNLFFACDTTNYLSHQYLFDLFCKNFSFSYKKLRSYVNCYPYQASGSFHPDDGDHTFLFYPDEEIIGKGATIFKDDFEVEYKTNRLIIFNARLLHKAGKNLSHQMRHSIAWKSLI